MADFNTHLVGAAAVSGVAATALAMTQAAPHQAVMGYFVLGVIGGLLPDIDSPSSIPLRVAFTLLAVSSGFLAVFAFAQRYSLAELTLLWLGGFLAVRYLVFQLFTTLTTHRGLIHSIPAGACFGLLTVLAAHRFLGATAIHAWLCGSFVTLGFLVHLLLDEFYSANLTGMTLKSSFGSAFSLGSLENPAGTLVLYLLLAGLYWLSPLPDALLQLLFSGETYRGVAERLWPGQGWFRGLLQISP